MKIVNVVPGFGGTFYCGNCLRDSAYVRTLQKEGHQAVTLPVYLPLSKENNFQPSEVPVFYGAVNIYLKQQFPLLRKMPAWLEHAFNSPAMLRLAASKAGSTRADGLEELTISMLKGPEGNQAGELQQLTDYLKNHEKPDVVHFSNALLLGMAGQVRKEAGIPVVCSLQDEDVWVDAMRSPYDRQVWQLLTEKVRDVDLFVAVSPYFASLMKEKMNIPEEKLKVVPIGVVPEEYPYLSPSGKPEAIGFLSRACKENGFDILVDAFILLHQEPAFQNLKLLVSGGYTSDDKPFLEEQFAKLRKNNLLEKFQIEKDFRQEKVKEFLSQVRVLSVPVLKGEAFGLYLLEAMASGVPIVQPALGAFPDIISTSRGGMTYQPNIAESLASTLTTLLKNPVATNSLSQQGRQSIEKVYNSQLTIKEMIRLYQGLLT